MFANTLIVRVLQSAFVKMPTTYFLSLSETRVGVWNRGDASESTMMMMNMRLRKIMIIRLKARTRAGIPSTAVKEAH